MANDFNVDNLYGTGTGAASYLKPADLIVNGQPRRVAVTISAVGLEDNYNKTGKQIVLSFVGKDKKFGLNTTNARMTADLLNERDAQKWIGKTITLRPDKTTNTEGKTVDCIRVDFELPPQAEYTPPAAQSVQHTQPMEVAAADIPF